MTTPTHSSVMSGSPFAVATAFIRQSVGCKDVSTLASVRVKCGQDRDRLGAVSGTNRLAGSLATPECGLAHKRDAKVCEGRDIVAGESPARA